MNVSHTERGFEFVEFVDLYNKNCSLQQSSLATKRAIWLGVNGERMHLDTQQANELILHLQMWLDTGSFKVSS